VFFKRKVSPLLYYKAMSTYKFIQPGYNQSAGECSCLGVLDRWVAGIHSSDGKISVGVCLQIKRSMILNKMND
jgi:hypothetical protein